MKVGRWSTTAASNNATPPDGWPEGQAPSTVNDCARENMAAIRAAFNDLQFFDQDFTPTFVSATSFTVPGDQTSAIHAGRRLKIFDATAGVATTIYATVTTASFTVVTTIQVVNDAGQLTSSLSSFAISILSNLNQSLPVGGSGTFDRLTASAAIIGNLSVSGNAVVSGALRADTTLTVSGAVVLKNTLTVSGAVTGASFKTTSVSVGPSGVAFDGSGVLSAGTLLDFQADTAYRFGRAVQSASTRLQVYTGDGTANVQHELAVTGGASLCQQTGGVFDGGTLTVSGATVLKGALTVGGAVNFGGAFAVSGGATLGGLAFDGSYNQNLSGPGATTIGIINLSAGSNGNIILRDGGTEVMRLRFLRATNNFEYVVSNNAQLIYSFGSAGSVVNSNLSVSGAVALNTTLTVSGAAYVGATFGVGSHASISGTLLVLGAFTLFNSMTVDGTTSLLGTLSVSAATALKSTLTVGGAVTMASTLTASGEVASLATLKTGIVTVASLGTATVGKRWMVSNSNASAFGTVVAGGGVITVPVWADGTNWKIG